MGSDRGPRRCASEVLVRPQESQGERQLPIAKMLACVVEMAKSENTYPSMVVDLQDSQPLAYTKHKLPGLSGVVIHFHGINLVHQWVDGNQVSHAEIFGRTEPIELAKV